MGEVGGNSWSVYNIEQSQLLHEEMNPARRRISDSEITSVTAGLVLSNSDKGWPIPPARR